MNLMGPFQLRIYSVGVFSPYLAQFLLRVQHPNLRKDLAALWHTHHAERNLCSIICAVPLPAPPAGSQEIRRLSINWCKKQDPSGLHTLCWCHSASLVVNFISNITNLFFFFFREFNHPRVWERSQATPQAKFYLWRHGIIALPRGNSRQILLPTHLRGQEFLWPHQPTPPSVPLDFPSFKWGLSWWGFEQDEVDLRHPHRPVSHFWGAPEVPLEMGFEVFPLLFPSGMTQLLTYCVPIPLPPVLRDFSLVHLYNDWINSGSTFHMNFLLWNCHTSNPLSSLSTTFPLII